MSSARYGSSRDLPSRSAQAAKSDFLVSHGESDFPGLPALRLGKITSTADRSAPRPREAQA